jgi:hypothetical protein
MKFSGWFARLAKAACLAPLCFLPSIAIGQGSLPLCSNPFPSDYCQRTITFTDGGKYFGDIGEGVPNGQGTLTYPDGYKYVGEFRNGKQHGRGKLTFPSGEKYVGEFSEGDRSGRGTLTFSSGNKYVGNFKNDKLNGEATATYPDGSKFVGEYGNGVRNGRGAFFASNGSVSYSGIWVNDKFLGTGASSGLVASGDQETIRMELYGGVYVVPVRFNDTITLNAVVDSGASDVSIPADIVSTLMRTKTVTSEDFLGKQIYVLADGSKVPSQQFRIRSLKVGNKTIENVVASIASVNGDILLGQSFLSKFRSWSVDNGQHTLILR